MFFYMLNSNSFIRVSFKTGMNQIFYFITQLLINLIVNFSDLTKDKKVVFSFEWESTVKEFIDYDS